ncbi:MAG: beta-ketoacyl-ACP synthase II [Chloroflexota bacterium]
MRRRVVITGLGAITCLGTGVEKTWQALRQGKSGIGLISRFDTSNFNSKIAGEVNDFEPLDFMTPKVMRRTDRFIHFAIGASRMAMDDAGLVSGPQNADRIGVIVGTTLGGMLSVEENHQLLLEGDKDQISPFFLPGFLANMAAGQVAIHLGARGPNLCLVTACASGTHAIGESLKIIQRGDADAMIAGGAEANITPTMLAALEATKVASMRNGEPQKASRPFDKDRDGFVFSEGAGMVALEELQSALKRGARIYAEVLGYGLSCDAHHITSPDPEGGGAARCMQLALNDAAVTAEAIDYICAHGTSTIRNDVAETQAIKTVFGERSHHIPVSSIKSMIGHSWGAAGAMEAISCALTITQDIIPPTINYETPDPECDLDYVPNVARKARVDTLISNSFGFGGTNGALIIGRFKP